MPRIQHVLALCLTLMAAPAFAAVPQLEITLAHDSAAEQATRAQLQRLVAAYDVTPWLFTRKIVIDEKALPHSHPVLTLHTRHLQDDELLLSTFVHEELHWFLTMHADAYEAAEAELRGLYPVVPVGYPEGSSDEKGNYAHLMIGVLEASADRQLMGELRARQVLAFWADDHYTWIYRKVMDPAERAKIGKVLREHDLIPAGMYGGPPLPAFAADQPATPPLPYTLPARMEHHRFFVQAQAADGQALQLFTDSGGGMNLTTTGADKLGLKYARPAEGAQEPAGTTPWPHYAGAWMPLPADAGDDFELPILVAPPGMHMDGMLGAPWFGGRTWEWDYRAGTLRLLPDGALPKADAAHVVKLGAQVGDDGAQTTHFMRIPARVDGVELQFLFDTGATFRLDEAAAAALGDAAVRERGGSFITTTVMQGWHARHPDWPYLAQGDGKAALIQVPEVEVAGFRTGPVWFSSRPDSAFHEYMAQWMDRPVDGALGGSAFAGFRITVDYPAATAVFER